MASAATTILSAHVTSSAHGTPTGSPHRTPSPQSAPSASGAHGSAGHGRLEDASPEALFARWQQHGERAAREALVTRYLPLARKLARRYDNTSEAADDLLQVASLGLLKAIDRFDPERGHPFHAFAVPTILGEIRRYFRDSGWSVHVPRGAQERALKVREAQEALVNEHGHAPTANQLAQYLECEREEVIDAMQALQAYEAVSLDAPRPGAEEDAGRTYGDSLGSVDGRYELVEMDASVRAVLTKIPARERHILHMRFVEDMTQTEIAAHVGVSQMQVSRLLRRSLAQLRTLTLEPAAQSLEAR
jgi:RNA polymerase sigma-B factor